MPVNSPQNHFYLKIYGRLYYFYKVLSILFFLFFLTRLPNKLRAGPHGDLYFISLMREVTLRDLSKVTGQVCAERASLNSDLPTHGS